MAWVQRWYFQSVVGWVLWMHKPRIWRADYICLEKQTRTLPFPGDTGSSKDFRRVTFCWSWETHLSKVPPLFFFFFFENILVFLKERTTFYSKNIHLKPETLLSICCPDSSHQSQLLHGIQVQWCLSHTIFEGVLSVSASCTCFTAQHWAFHVGHCPLLRVNHKPQRSGSMSYLILFWKSPFLMRCPVHSHCAVKIHRMNGRITKSWFACLYFYKSVIREFPCSAVTEKSSCATRGWKKVLPSCDGG
jgi:hypothetical protein